jgi:hypothetical protein
MGGDRSRWDAVLSLFADLRNEWARDLKEHREQSVYDWARSDTKIDRLEQRLMGRVAKMETTLERIKEAMLKSGGLNGGSKKAATAKGPNLFLIEQLTTRITVVCGAIVAVAAVVGTAIATYAP